MKGETHTVLDAVGAPLAFDNLAEHCDALVEQLIHDTVLG